ncbi:ATP-binding protein [Spirosoma oryzicola]|uniref:ATP-binding response regulator n=1 Tax=Spirosoma oryzicola TaxID=2898794 RepID=UPI0031343310
MNKTESTEQFLGGGGEMGKLIRSMDWSQTPLGPVSSWPQSLRTSVSLCLSSTFPILIAWGPETIQIYNDSYRPICGAKHPESMGQNFRICWETALPVVGDAFTRGQQGEGTYIKDQRMFLDRNGYLEEAFMTFSFAPIRDESGEVGGIFHPITETTDKMLSARRTQALRDIAAATGQVKTNEEIYSNITATQSDAALDLPFLLFYEFQNGGTVGTLVQAAGLSSAPTSQQLDVAATNWIAEWPKTLIINELNNSLGVLEGGPYPEPTHTAVVLPIYISNKAEPFGFLIAGVSPRRELDIDYLNFYELLGNTINTAFSNVYAYQEEQKRAEALAAIDQAKTAFFSNISHEFRTPLTLILGPLEELLQDASFQASAYKEPVESTHRNALRLLKLVNNLLDFSRIEAGRVKASYRPLDLVGLTTDLASSFRSLIEKAGLSFVVDCQPLTSVAYVDAEMWEKIVLNLLSNAFKYTLQGAITIQLRQEQDTVVLTVIDTGVGIPEREIPHMFERFHRVENAGGRTHEGTGIGLSLVSELVRLHHGVISVNSAEGKGSTFTVRIPLGKTHLLPSQIIEEKHQKGLTKLADSFIQEASTMMTSTESPVSQSELPAEDEEVDKSIRILVVDDNADMRAYLVRLLTPYFTVRTAVNGADALAQLTNYVPQLILSDIMMPVMDGKELLSRIKDNPATTHIPLVFLSARAGQEARIDGLEAGADDYLVKPFSAKELLTKIRAQVAISQSRRQAENRLSSLVQQAPVAMMLVKGDQLVIELINQAMLALLDRDTDIVGQPLLTALPELDGQSVADQFREVYKTGKSTYGWAVEVPVTRDGQLETGYFNITFAPYYEGDTIAGVLEVCTEVTDLIRASRALEASEQRYRQLSAELDQQVQQRTEQLQASIQDLQRSNDNLQQFAYIASHDLQEPLRKIQSFGDLLKNKYTDQLGDGTAYLERMQFGANRMSLLIKDLLAFSRISTRQDASAPVSLNSVLKMVLTDLELTIQETGAVIEVGPLPTIMGDKSQLGQLFQNLVSNALKFRQVDRTPHIQISAQTVSALEMSSLARPTRMASAYTRIDVADNGIGFDEKYLDRIFQVFQRLHSKSQYPGTGIGLAICEKVAINHGGAITAVSTPKQGTTFQVYFPMLW